VEPYNALVSLEKLICNSDQTYMLDNEALYNIAVRTLKMPMPTYENLNSFTSAAMAGTTCGLQFPGRSSSGGGGVGGGSSSSSRSSSSIMWW